MRFPARLLTCRAAWLRPYPARLGDDYKVGAMLPDGAAKHVLIASS
jgi:hypothetical protein